MVSILTTCRLDRTYNSVLSATHHGTGRFNTESFYYTLDPSYLHRVQRHVHVDEHGVVVGKVASFRLHELQENLGRDERVVLDELGEHLGRKAGVEHQRGVPL